VSPVGKKIREKSFMSKRRKVKTEANEVRRDDDVEREDTKRGSLESSSRRPTEKNGDEVTNLKTEMKSSQRKRRSTAIASHGDVSVDDEEEERNVAELRPLNQFVAGCSSYHIEIPSIELKQPQSIKWDRVPVETAKGLAKATARVLLMKGGRGDKITLEHIRAALGDYKLQSRAAIKAAQQLLRQIFGYDVVITKDPDNLYVVNTIKSEPLIFANSLCLLLLCCRSPALRRILAGADRDAGYRGFCFAIFICIWTSPGRKIDTAALLRNMRKSVSPSLPPSSSLLSPF
jgi:hypothetical protein